MFSDGKLFSICYFFHVLHCQVGILWMFSRCRIANRVELISFSTSPCISIHFAMLQPIRLTFSICLIFSAFIQIAKRWSLSVHMKPVCSLCVVGRVDPIEKVGYIYGWWSMAGDCIQSIPGANTMARYIVALAFLALAAAVCKFDL